MVTTQEMLQALPVEMRHDLGTATNEMHADALFNYWQGKGHPVEEACRKKVFNLATQVNSLYTETIPTMNVGSVIRIVAALVTYALWFEFDPHLDQNEVNITVKGGDREKLLKILAEVF